MKKKNNNIIIKLQYFRILKFNKFFCETSFNLAKKQIILNNFIHRLYKG